MPTCLLATSERTLEVELPRAGGSALKPHEGQGWVALTPSQHVSQAWHITRVLGSRGQGTKLPFLLFPFFALVGTVGL